jgi:hypothetical protein
MPERTSQGQADKAEAERKTAEVGAEQRQTEQDAERRQRAEASTSAAAKVLQVDPGEASANPFPAYDLMTLDQLREVASERGVEINRDVEKAHLITELRAADTGVPSATTRLGAR